MFAVGITALLVAGFSTFMAMASRSISGTTAQTSINTDAAQASDFIFSRIRLATFLSNDFSGNRLTLGFDDNEGVDSDGDGNSYNDRNHFEYFEFRNGDGNDTTVEDNRIVYNSNIGLSPDTLLVNNGVRLLPFTQIFSVTNGGTVLIHFGLVDIDKNDSYQGCEIQEVVVSRNRPASLTNVVAVLP